MAKKDDVLSLHHMGEVLCARLFRALEPGQIGTLRVVDPRNDTETSLSDVLAAVRTAPPDFQPSAQLEAADGRTFDGMHDIDCALVFKDVVVGMELKLGTTRMRPSEFRTRFVTDGAKQANVPQLRGNLVDGSMVAFLDWNGRCPPTFKSTLHLRSLGKPVQPQWLLMVVDETLAQWRVRRQLGSTLGTQQLMGILSLQSVAKSIGSAKAKEIAKSIACAEIDRWSL
jgi:hypothetical protein